jgi:hypothetical protein
MYMFYGIYINETLSLTDSIVGIKLSNLTYFRSRIRQLLDSVTIFAMLLIFYYRLKIYKVYRIQLALSEYMEKQFPISLL